MLFLVLVIVVPLGMLGWLVFFTDTFVVSAVTVVDAKEHTGLVVRDLVEPHKGKNIFFISTIPIQEELLREVPQLRDVHIVRKLPGTMKVIVQEKEPSLLLLSSGQYYLVDKDGIAYEEVGLDTLPGIVLPIVKNSDENAAVVLGTSAVDVEFVSFVENAQKMLPETIGAQVVEMRIPAISAREVHFLLDNNWIIRLDTTRSFEKQFGVLQRLLEHSISAEEKEMIEYIDLRIPNRVYYKTTIFLPDE